jgi:hypothetical protein
MMLFRDYIIFYGKHTLRIGGIFRNFGTESNPKSSQKTVCLVLSLMIGNQLIQEILKHIMVTESSSIQ